MPKDPPSSDAACGNCSKCREEKLSHCWVIDMDDAGVDRWACRHCDFTMPYEPQAQYEIGLALYEIGLEDEPPPQPDTPDGTIAVSVDGDRIALHVNGAPVDLEFLAALELTTELNLAMLSVQQGQRSYRPLPNLSFESVRAHGIPWDLEAADERSLLSCLLTQANIQQEGRGQEVVEAEINYERLYVRMENGDEYLLRCATAEFRRGPGGPVPAAIVRASDEGAQLPTEPTDKGAAEAWDALHERKLQGFVLRVSRYDSPDGYRALSLLSHDGSFLEHLAINIPGAQLSDREFHVRLEPSDTAKGALALLRSEGLAYPTGQTVRYHDEPFAEIWRLGKPPEKA